MPATSPRLSANLACLIAIIAVGIAVRLFLGYELEPVPFPDTRGFERLAHRLMSMDWGSHDGRRAPGYSLFLIAFGLNHHVVWIAQAVLGVVTSVVGFKIVLALTRNRLAAFITGLIISMSINQLLFEIAILTEALTTMMLMLIALMVVRTGVFEQRAYSSDIWLGLLAGCTTMVQPRFAIVIVVCGLGYFLFPTTTSERFGRIKHCSAFLAAALPAVLVWSFVNLFTVGYFGVSTVGTSNLVTHTVRFVEKAPREFDDMSSILLSYREKLRVEHGEEAVPFTIEHARKELLRVNNYSMSTMQSRLARMSFRLIGDHPGLYLSSVAKSWWRFWQPVRVNYEGFFTPHIRDAWFRDSLLAVWRAQDAAWPAIYALFAVVSLAALTGVGFSQDRKVRRYCVIVALFVALASILQAILTGGDNQRFALPCQALIITADMCCLWHWLRRQAGSSSTNIS